MKTLQALVLGTSMLALGGVATAQDRTTGGPGASAPAVRMMKDRAGFDAARRGGGDPEAYHNGRRIVGPGDPTMRQSRWRGREGRWEGRRWRHHGDHGGGYYGWRDRDWHDPYGPFAGGFPGFWPFPAFTAFDAGYGHDPVWIDPVPRRRVWMEHHRWRYGYGPAYRNSVENPSRGAQSGK